MDEAGWQKKYGNEDSCFEVLKKTKWPDGFVCSNCQYKKFNYLKSRKVFQCNKCKHQESLTAGTIFHSTKISLAKWFLAIYHLGSNRHGHGISALSLSKLLEIEWRSAKLILHKIRKIMGDKEKKSILDGLIECLGCCIVETKEIDYEKQVSFIHEEEYNFLEKNKKPPVLYARYLNYAHTDKKKWIINYEPITNETILVAVENKCNMIGSIAFEQIKPTNTYKDRISNFIETRFKTDESQMAYPDYFKKIKVEIREDSKPDEWVPVIKTVVNYFNDNIKRIYLCVSKKYLQDYMNEFCYRFNRRFCSQRLINDIVTDCLYYKRKYDSK